MHNVASLKPLTCLKTKPLHAQHGHAAVSELPRSLAPYGANPTYSLRTDGRVVSTFPCTQRPGSINEDTGKKARQIIWEGGW